MNIFSSNFDKKIVGTVAMLVLLLTAVFYGLWMQKAHAASARDGRLITIHDSGDKKVVISKADTVKQVLDNANVDVMPDDNVDPQLDTKLTAQTYHINVYRAHPVIVIDGNIQKLVMTPYETPRQIAEKADLTWYDEDEAELVRSQDLLNSDGAGLEMNIKRATKFNLVLYGKVIEARTQEKTVKQMLEDKKVKLSKSDTVSLPLETPISAGMTVEIWRNGVQTLNEEQAIDFPVQQIQDASQPVGFKEIRTPGVLGKKLVTYEINMKNGQELSRREIQVVQISAPQQQVEVVGAKPDFSGDFAAALAKLRSCEGGYTSVNDGAPNQSDWYYGAYQFNQSAWNSNAPLGYAGTNPSQAPPAVQDQAARNYYMKSGWRPWPNCGRNLPDSYR